MIFESHNTYVTNESVTLWLAPITVASHTQVSDRHFINIYRYDINSAQFNLVTFGKLTFISVGCCAQDAK